MKYYGICPASCGEFVQGIMDRDEYRLIILTLLGWIGYLYCVILWQ